MSEELKAALARIACLEGEIAKRDEELAACRVAVENCEVFRARIVELESQYQRDVYGLNNEGDPIGGEPAGGYANDNARLRAELAALKAQGVVMPERKEFPELMMAEYHEVRGWNSCLDEVARLNAAPVQQPKCRTCDDNGLIGGPSFYSPDEGGEPCPDCCSPVQQVSVPDGKVCVPVEVLRLYEFMAASFTPFTSQHEQIAISLRKAKAAMLAAAPAAPAADAGGEE